MSNNSVKSNPDWVLLGAVVCLLVFGILILTDVSASVSLDRFGTTFYYLNHQILFGILPGIILGYILFKVDLKLIKKWSPIFLLGNIILLAAVFLPVIGFSAGGAARWLDFGIFTFQPSESLKLIFILYLAVWLSAKTEKKPEKTKNQTFLSFCFIVAIIGFLLFLQPDLSTFGIIVMTAMIMYFVANTPLLHIAFLGAMGLGAIAALAPLAQYRFQRILVFFRPETDPMGIGYQIKQSLIAIGSGGIFGLGLGMSRQKYGFLPESMADSIFAVLAEETGFIGCLILILLFLTILLRGFKIGKGSQDRFSQLAAIGITSWILIQALINVGAMSGIFPLTGVPLPFISYGGTAIIAELAGVGLLLKISKNTAKT